MMSSKRVWIVLLTLAFLGCACSLGLAQDEAQVQQKFEAFEKVWIKKLNEQGKYGEARMRVEKGAGGGALYAARYEVIKERATRSIEKTNQPATPYIGVMRYEIWTCSAFGKTPEEAKAGKFECELQNHIREIFRYNGKEWLY
jgi:hypothetical protein